MNVTVTIDKRADTAGQHTYIRRTDAGTEQQNNAKIFVTVFPKVLLCRRVYEKNRDFRQISRVFLETLARPGGLQWGGCCSGGLGAEPQRGLGAEPLVRGQSPAP